MPWPGKLPPSHDRTLKDAELDAQRDYARLAHGHIVSWSLQIFTGTVMYSCSCDSPGPRTSEQLDQHILTAIRKARGPNPYKRT